MFADRFGTCPNYGPGVWSDLATGPDRQSSKQAKFLLGINAIVASLKRSSAIRPYIAESLAKSYGCSLQSIRLNN